ncbi:hypothetical protein LTR15_008783 [Elasticomyces elasticus]|nr:hypothetical protein LTR15_008783 [Elasticomyces elasticus]
MAALVATYNGDLLVRDWLRRDTRPKTGPTDTRHELRIRLRALAAHWEQSCRDRVVCTQDGASPVRKDLFRPVAAPQIAGSPVCDDSATDLPPDYTVTEALANVQLDVSTAHRPDQDRLPAAHSETGDVDLTTPTGIRYHAKKKAKQAAKAAQNNSWGSGDEGEKPPGGEGEDGAPPPDGDAGTGAGGDGGDPPGDGGNGGNDGDDWAGATTAKGKKKKKKNPFEEYEAEEAAKNAELDGDAAPAAAAEPDAGDDWGASFSTGKKKKGKKGAFEPEPEPVVVEPVLDSIDFGGSPTAEAPAEANLDDEFGFSTGKKKKGKKGKNDPVPPPPPPAPENDMKFDDINLNDDKSAPKLDLDFGLDAPAAETKSSGFSFGGGWGGGWGSGAAKEAAPAKTSWGFGGVDEEKVEDIPKVDTSWDFGAAAPGGKKDKKKKGGFDFDFDDLGGGDAGDPGAGEDLASPLKEEPVAEADPSPTTGKKSKKGAKKGVVEEPIAVIDVPPPPPPAPVEEVKEDDAWGSFSGTSSKKDKKKGKKSGFGSEPQSAVEPEIIPEPLPEPEAPAEPEPPAEDSWGGFGMSAKDKKKLKKGKAAPTPVEEPEVVVVPEPEPEPAAPPADDFSSFLPTSKKDKKKKKGAFEEWPAPVEEKIIDVPPPPPPAPIEEPPPPVEDTWGTTSTKKSKKGAKKNPFDEVASPAPTPAAEKPAGGEDWFGGWGGKDGKDDAPADENNFMQPEAVVEPIVDSMWTTGTKAKGSKKSKSKGIVEVVDDTPAVEVLQPESVQDKAEEDQGWSAFGTVGKKDKKKGAKKDLWDAPAPAEPEQPLDDFNLDTTSTPALVDFNEAPADDPWASITPVGKKGKLKKGAKAETPVDTKLTKTKSGESKEAANDFLDMIDEPPALPSPPPPPPEPVVEAKPAKSGWGVGSLFGSKTSSKSSKERDREAKEAAEREAQEKKDAERAAAAEEQRLADEALFAAAIGEDPNEILEIIDEAPPKKSSKDSKLKGSKDKASKTDSKSKTTKKSELKEEPIVVEEPPPDPIVDIMDEAPPEEPASAGWSFFGAGLKSSKTGKKATSGAEMSKEIGTPDAWANDGDGLTEPPKMPEVTIEDPGVKSATSPFGKATKDTPSSKSKTKSSSIQDRIKALQGDSVDPPAKITPDSRKSKAKDAAPPPPPEEPLTIAEEAEPVIVAPPEDRKSSKKSTSKSTSSKKDRKDLAPITTDDPVSVPPFPSISPLPGGFPSEDFVPDMPASPPKSSAKDRKSSSKASKPSKSSKQEPAIVEAPPAPDTFDDLMGLDDTTAKLPTPPPEKSSKDDSKGHKKERPKVVRDQDSRSWGFWGATPPAKSSTKKSDSRSKDGTVSPVKERPATLSRSKSARKPTEKEPVASKSSGSDKDVRSATKSRPSSSRGQSFGAMFGLGSTPSRSKSTRIPSSRRQSNAVDDTGMMSPQSEDRTKPEVSDKAAKLMGMSRSKSTRDKPKARKVPDPYPIDSDDMIVVDGPEDSAKDMAPPEKSREKSRRSKRESTMMSGGLGGAEDTVMVDAPVDDLAFDVRPPLVRRATTSAKKPGLMGGILGAFSSRPAAPDRRQTKGYDSEEGSRRKRESVYEDDRAKRLRRDDRKVNRVRKPSDPEGGMDGEAEDPEAKEARRAERRARRDREAADEEARAARRAEREEARKAKAREEEDRLRQEDEEREARKKEERRAKRAEREVRRAEEDRLAREEEARTAERRERRRERERQRTEGDEPSRPKTSERRQSYAPEQPEDDEGRRIRREERRLRRSADPTATPDKERPRTARRRTDHPAPVNDYFGNHNGEPASRNRGEPEADGIPYIKAGGDKTTSWVHSLNSSPPPPPPVEGTIIDAPAHFTADDDVPATHPFEETTAREMRHKRVRDSNDPERRRRDRRERDGEGIKSSSGGSGHDRSQSYGGPVNSIGFNDMGEKTWDGRPAVQRSESKRGSWFKKIAGGL